MSQYLAFTKSLGSLACATAPITGAHHGRCSVGDIKVRAVNTATMVLDAPAGVTFDVYEWKTAGDALIVSGATNGTSFPTGDGHEYYVANPKGATAPFAVGFILQYVTGTPSDGGPSGGGSEPVPYPSPAPSTLPTPPIGVVELGRLVSESSILSSAPISQTARSSFGDLCIEEGDSQTVTLRAPSGVSFDLKSDIPGGIDGVVLTGATDGATFEATAQRNYYIAKPSGAGGDFTVVFLLAS